MLLQEEIIIKVENDIEVPALVAVAANVSDHERKRQSKIYIWPGQTKLSEQSAKSLLTKAHS